MPSATVSDLDAISTAAGGGYYFLFSGSAATTTLAFHSLGMHLLHGSWSACCSSMALHQFDVPFVEQRISSGHRFTDVLW
jgi:hypothetical protein